MLKKKQRVILEEHLFDLKCRERVLHVLIEDTRASTPGELAKLEEYDHERANVSKEMLETARVLNESTPNWGQTIGDWGIRLSGAAITTIIAVHGCIKNNKYLVEAEDKMGLMSSGTQKKLQNIKIPFKG